MANYQQNNSKKYLKSNKQPFFSNFLREPFCMDNDEMSLLFARYLIEDNIDEVVIFNEN